MNKWLLQRNHNPQQRGIEMTPAERKERLDKVTAEAEHTFGGGVK
jgi:hypothetical protein